MYVHTALEGTGPGMGPDPLPQVNTYASIGVSGSKEREPSRTTCTTVWTIPTTVMSPPAITAVGGRLFGQSFGGAPLPGISIDTSSGLVRGLSGTPTRTK